MDKVGGKRLKTKNCDLEVILVEVKCGAGLLTSRRSASGVGIRGETNLRTNPFGWDGHDYDFLSGLPSTLSEPVVFL
jgi:hypothetical protein